MTKSILKEIQKSLDTIKYPQSINRKYLKIKNCFTWKASETRTFFLYVALPVLKHHLKGKYVWNLSNLVIGLRLLHTIQKPMNTKTTKNLIDSFCISLPNLYGQDCLTYTLHLVRYHLIEDAARHGSLSYHSMFSAEGCFDYFKRAIKGNRGISKQFIKSKLIDIILIIILMQIVYLFRIRYSNAKYNYEGFKWIRKERDQ